MTTRQLQFLERLRCPLSGEKLYRQGNRLTSAGGRYHYWLTDSGIPLFAETHCSAEGRVQQAHYDRIAGVFIENLDYPHTQEYSNYIDNLFLQYTDVTHLAEVAEICCGRGESFLLLKQRIQYGVGVDISLAMLEAARKELSDEKFFFVQGDATMLPLERNQFDSVFLLGGIHHVNNREQLFAEVYRILKPGGRLYWREPVSDFFLWRWLRTIIYRLSPTLDYETERPLRYAETVPPLQKAGLHLKVWRTCGFFGFCLFMNSDVLVFNRLFRFVPGIRSLTRLAAHLDDWIIKLPGLQRAGLQVIGVAEKPEM